MNIHYTVRYGCDGLKFARSLFYSVNDVAIGSQRRSLITPLDRTRCTSYECHSLYAPWCVFSTRANALEVPIHASGQNQICGVAANERESMVWICLESSINFEWIHGQQRSDVLRGCVRVRSLLFFGCALLRCRQLTSKIRFCFPCEDAFFAFITFELIILFVFFFICRIGLSGFDNPMRDPKTDELKRHIGQVRTLTLTYI